MAGDIGMSIGMKKGCVPIKADVIGQHDNLVGIGPSDGSGGR